MLEDTLSDNQVQTLCNCVLRVFKGLSDDGDNEKVAVGESGESAKEDYIIKCDEIVLAVTGKQFCDPRRCGSSVAAATVLLDKMAWGRARFLVGLKHEIL